jgi:hypothetical protein
MEKETSTHIHYADLQLVSLSPIIDKYGTKHWRNESGQLHREDGPATEWTNGDKSWWLHGKLHRKDGPAIEQAEGHKAWYKNGQQHRCDGPAVELVDGSKEWRLNGERHREDGPAVEWADGTKEWYLNGQLHRVNGPAIERADGHKAWYLNNKLHRENGPAIERSDGHKAWYLNGEFCRKEVAIVEWSDKTNRWCFPDRVKLAYTEIELEFLPDIFEETQAVYSQEGGVIYDQDGWLHLEGSFPGQELESLLAVIAPCIKTPVQLILTKPDSQGEQTLTLDKSGVYDQSGYEIVLDNTLEKVHRLLNLSNY